MSDNIPSGITLIRNGVFNQENYGSSYLIEGEELTLVDPGTSESVPRLLNWFDAGSFSLSELSNILLTHIHLDHAGATGHLVDMLPNLKVYVHERGVSHLIDPSDLLSSVKEATGNRFPEYGTVKPIPEKSIVSLSDRSIFKLGSRSLIALPTPGHAPHHLIYQDCRSKAVFVGDSAGLNFEGKLIPATTPPSFDLKKSLKSLDKIKKLSPSVLLYSHFGAESEPIKLLTEYGRLLRDWVRLVSSISRSYQGEDKIVDELLKRKKSWLGNGFTEEELIMNLRGVRRYLSWKMD